MQLPLQVKVQEKELLCVSCSSMPPSPFKTKSPSETEKHAAGAQRPSALKVWGKGGAAQGFRFEPGELVVPRKMDLDSHHEVSIGPGP